jgi:hypothetical protein
MTKTNVNFREMGVKEDIELLNDKINQLRIEYEKYFIGSNKAEPLSLKREVERLIKRYGNRFIENTALRFRYNGLVAKFNTYNQYWERKVKNIYEEGRFQGDIAKFKPKKIISDKAPKTLIAEDKVKKLYSEYIEARILCNEPVDNINYERIKSIIEKEIPSVIEKYNCKDIDLKVKIENNHAKIKIIPKK